VEFFGLAFLRGVTVFTLVDLVNALGIMAFEGGHVDFGELLPAAAFRAAGIPGGADPDGVDGAAAFRHVSYQELLTAEFLRSDGGR
jgi:hypothetical protein